MTYKEKYEQLIRADQLQYELLKTTEPGVYSLIEKEIDTAAPAENANREYIKNVIRNYDAKFTEQAKQIESFKTKELHSDLKQFDYKSALFIHSESGIDKNFKLASSNIPKVSILNQKGINVKDLISFDKIFIEQKSINEITKRLSWKIKYHRFLYIKLTIL